MTGFCLSMKIISVKGKLLITLSHHVSLISLGKPVCLVSIGDYFKCRVVLKSTYIFHRRKKVFNDDFIVT